MNSPAKVGLWSNLAIGNFTRNFTLFTIVSNPELVKLQIDVSRNAVIQPPCYEVIISLGTSLPLIYKFIMFRISGTPFHDIRFSMFISQRNGGDLKYGLVKEGRVAKVKLLV